LRLLSATAVAGGDAPVQGGRVVLRGRGRDGGGRLPGVRGHHPDRQGERRAGHPPGLRLPVRELRVRQALRGGGHRLHRHGLVLPDCLLIVCPYTFTLSSSSSSSSSVYVCSIQCLILPDCLLIACPYKFTATSPFSFSSSSSSYVCSIQGPVSSSSVWFESPSESRRTLVMIKHPCTRRLSGPWVGKTLFLLRRPLAF